jgi:hypothetical protein
VGRMSEIPFIPSMRPEPQRDRFGRYVLPDPAEGALRSWTRATTIAHALDDEFHLSQWKRRMVLSGAALRPGLLAAVPELTRALIQAKDDWRAAKEIKAELDGLCDEAAEAAGAGDGAKLGTLLHTVTEYDDAGRAGEIAHLVPVELLDDLSAYVRTMDAAGLGRPPEYIERIVVNSRVDGAGTFDRLLRLPDGRLVVGDLKTQKSVDFGFLSIAIQLAEYAQADAMYDDETQRLVPLPDELDKSIGIVMHLPVGTATCTLYELDLEAGWEAALAAHDVRQWRSRSKALGRAYVPRAEPAGDHTLFLIRSAGHPNALKALWRDVNGRGEWTTDHTRAAAARKAELLAGALAG